MDAKTVGAVAALTGVSVRTLHHYDHIGLVVPSVRTPAGYRGYTDADIERLHLVLVYRSVGLQLEEIRALLDDSARMCSSTCGDSTSCCSNRPTGCSTPSRQWRN